MGAYFSLSGHGRDERGCPPPVMLNALGVTHTVFAVTPFMRLKGMLGCSDPHALFVIAPCRDIHTCGMRIAIDVAFISRHGQVVGSHRNVRPWKRLRHRDAAFVIERQSSEKPWFAQGKHFSQLTRG